MNKIAIVGKDTVVVCKVTEIHQRRSRICGKLLLAAPKSVVMISASYMHPS